MFQAWTQSNIMNRNNLKKRFKHLRKARLAIERKKLVQRNSQAPKSKLQKDLQVRLQKRVLLKLRRKIKNNQQGKLQRKALQKKLRKVQAARTLNLILVRALNRERAKISANRQMKSWRFKNKLSLNQKRLSLKRK